MTEPCCSLQCKKHYQRHTANCKLRHLDKIPWNTPLRTSGAKDKPGSNKKTEECSLWGVNEAGRWGEKQTSCSENDLPDDHHRDVLDRVQRVFAPLWINTKTKHGRELAVLYVLWVKEYKMSLMKEEPWTRDLKADVTSANLDLIHTPCGCLIGTNHYQLSLKLTM